MPTSLSLYAAQQKRTWGTGPCSAPCSERCYQYCLTSAVVKRVTAETVGDLWLTSSTRLYTTQGAVAVVSVRGSRSLTAKPCLRPPILTKEPVPVYRVPWGSSWRQTTTAPRRRRRRGVGKLTHSETSNGTLRIHWFHGELGRRRRPLEPRARQGASGRA